MKKIMFSTEYGLEQAVLSGTKTQTRRIMMPPKKFKGKEDLMLEYHRRLSEKVFYDCVVCDADGHELGQLPLPYEMGDTVAIAQTYKRAGWQPTAVQYQEKEQGFKAEDDSRTTIRKAMPFEVDCIVPKEFSDMFHEEPTKV
jgi:hypothetical protein